MVTVLRRLVEKVICLANNSQNINPHGMAWRSVGSDNADLINQLEGKAKQIYFQLETFTGF